MQNYKNDQLVKDENQMMDVAILTTIGNREEQQDMFGYHLMNNECIVVICDGMGGHKGGKLASSISVEQFLRDYRNHYPAQDPISLLMSSAKSSDAAISELRNDSGEKLNAGSTCVSVIIREKQLYWCSVGDSRAYLLRGEEFVQLTQDQNYKTVLGERLRTGEITDAEYRLEMGRGEALISYLGIGELSLIDYNSTPLSLESGDKIILMTDGLYKTVPETEIQQILENFRNSAEALQALDKLASKTAKAKRFSRDNLTAAIITIH